MSESKFLAIKLLFSVLMYHEKLCRQGSGRTLY